MPSVLITGANRGLGLEFAKQYAGDGWSVFAGCRDPLKASDLGQLATARPRNVNVLALDVTNLASVKAAATELAAQAIDLLLNNAGISGTPGQTVGNVDYRSWANVFDVNTMGAMRVTEAFVEQVARSERKLIVTITSDMGSIGDNSSGGSIAYRSSKAAVNMAMRSAAFDLRPRGIVCVVVHPGWVRTDMGGPYASLTARESVAALRRLIATLDPQQSGKFFNYNGRQFPW